jgi:polyhydroxyalkanoate synthesis regulator phasin
MRFNRWMALPAAGVLALAIGVLAVSAAPSPSPSASAGKNYAQVFIDKLAGILHLTPAQTSSDLKSAEMATIDQMVQDGRITKAQGDALKARIQNGQGLGFGFGPEFGRPGFGDRAILRDLRTAEMNAVASALKLSPADLQSQLRSGKSLSQLETQQKVSDATVQSAVHNAAKGVLDKAVKAGTITQQQEDMLLSHLGSMPFKFGFGHHGFHGPGAPAAPTAPAIYYGA